MKSVLLLLVLFAGSLAIATTEEKRFSAQTARCEGALRAVALKAEIISHVDTFFRAKMREKGITQAMMGKYLGRKASAVNHLFNGRTIPSIRDLLIMGDVLGLSIEETFPPGWVKAPVEPKITGRGSAGAPKVYVALDLLDRVFKVVSLVNVEPNLKDRLMKISTAVTAQELKNNTTVTDQQILVAVLTYLYRSSHPAVTGLPF